MTLDSELKIVFARLLWGIILEGLDGKDAIPQPIGQIGKTAKFAQPEAARRVSYKDVASDILVATRKNESPHKPLTNQASLRNFLAIQ